tara:strand:+ start:399 stop:1403 length:1005 start_codon:yes stop_codon:yes gene_type:complete
MNRIASATLTLLASTALLAQDAKHIEWIADFDVAVAAAKKANKDLLVDFTGSDWCGWCIRLHKEVFDHPEFQAGVEKHFVMVALDFPRAEEIKAKVPNPERNKELQNKYGVRGFPTILLMTADGEVYGRTGYQKGGPVPYVESLDKMRIEGKKNLAEIKDLVGKFEVAQGVSRTAVVGMAIEKLAGMSGDAVGIAQLATIAKVALQSEDLAVQEKAVTALLKTGQGDAACNAKALELDPDNKKGLFEITVQAAMQSVTDDASAKAFLKALDGLVEKGAKDAGLLESMLVNATRWTSGPLKDEAASKKYGKLLKEHAKDPAKHAKLLDKVLGEDK